MDRNSFNNAVYIIDEGFLLHCVVWQTKEKFSSILTKYVEYVKRYYGQGATVVFDGYPEEASSRSIKAVSYTHLMINKIFLKFDVYS